MSEVLAAVRRELGLRSGAVSGGGVRLDASTASLALTSSLADLQNIDHRLSQLEREGDDIRDRWAAALAAGDEPIFAPNGWQPEPPDPLRFVNRPVGGKLVKADGATGAIPAVSAAHVAAGARHPAVLRLAPTEVQGIRSQRRRYREYLKSVGGLPAEAEETGFGTAELTGAIAERLLDEMLTEAAGELLSASDAIVGHLVANETGAGVINECEAPPSLRAPPPRVRTPSVIEAEANYGDDFDEEEEENYDDEDDYGNQEFESEHSSDGRNG